MRHINYKEVCSWFGKSFVQYEEVALALSAAWNSRQNIILFGKGGYGKSEFAEEFGKFLVEKNQISPKDTYVLSLNASSTEDKILGGTDMKKLMTDGEICYLLQYAFTNFRYVIFEELFDASSLVLSSLKDILQSGYVRNGNQVEKVKTEMIVGCTNFTRENFVVDNSTEALMQRFMLSMEIVWENHDISAYREMFVKRFPNVAPLQYEMFLQIIEEANSTVGNTIGHEYVSPRSSVKGFNILQDNDFNYRILKYVYSISRGYAKMKDRIGRQILIIENKKAITEFAETIGNFVSSNLIDKSIRNVKRVDAYVIVLKALENAPAALDENADYLQHVKNIIKEKAKNLFSLIKNQASLTKATGIFQRIVDTEINDHKAFEELNKELLKHFGK